MEKGKGSLWKFPVLTGGLWGRLIEGRLSMNSLVKTHLFSSILSSWYTKAQPWPHPYPLTITRTLSTSDLFNLAESLLTKFLILVSEGSLVLLWECLLVDWWISFHSFHLPQLHSDPLLHASMVIFRALYFSIVIPSLVRARSVTLDSGTPSSAFKWLCSFGHFLLLSKRLSPHLLIWKERIRPDDMWRTVQPKFYMMFLADGWFSHEILFLTTLF